MSDQRRRSLERAALSTGSPDDEARVLLERLRAEPPCKECGGRGRTYVEDRDAARDALTRPTTADGMRPTVDAINAVLFVTPKPCSRCAGTGSLLRARVECAAYAGSEAAWLALGLSEFGLWDSAGVWHDGADKPVVPAYRVPTFLRDWLSGLSRWGVEAQVAASLGAARVACAAWEQSADGSSRDAPTCDRHWPAPFEVQHDGPPWPQDVLDCSTCTNHGPRRAIDAVEAWLRCPNDLAYGAWDEAWNAATDQWGSPLWLPRQAHHEIGIRAACEVAGEPAVREAAASAVRRWALGGEA